MSTNYYKLIKTPKVHNPNYNINHPFTIPMRLGIIGSSGSGKTNLLIDIISRFSKGKGTFKNLIVYLRSRHEPLYDFLAEKAPETQFIEVNDPACIIPLDSLDDQTLVVFDDLVTLTDKQTIALIAEYFIRGRKIGISCVYISQSYFSIAKVIRQQLTYLAIKRINSKKDLALILNEFPLGIDIDDLISMYTRIAKGMENSLIIDLIKSDIYINFKKVNT